MPADQWIVRPAAPVDYGALLGLFPDPNATYVLNWGVLAPFGYKMAVVGEFPRARFFDIQAVPSYAPGAYASGYNGMAELLDVDVPALPGHVNPYRLGADRLAERRGYRQEFTLAMGEPDALNPRAYAFPFRDEDPARYATGIMNTGPLSHRPSWRRAPFIIRAAVGEPRREWSAGEMWLRTYAPDRGTGPLGGAPLPMMHYETPEGPLLRRLRRRGRGARRERDPARRSRPGPSRPDGRHRAGGGLNQALRHPALRPGHPQRQRPAHAGGGAPPRHALCGQGRRGGRLSRPRVP